MASILINPDSNGQHMLPAEVPFALQSVVEQFQWEGFASQVNARLATELAESKSPCFRLLTAVSYIPTFVIFAGILASFVMPVEYFGDLFSTPGLIYLVVFSMLAVGVGGKCIEGRARMALFTKTFEDLDQICDQHGARIPNVTFAVVDHFRLAQAMGQPQMPSFLQGQVTNMRGRMLILMAQGTGITPTPMVGAMGMQMQAGPVLMQSMRPLQIQPPQQQQFLGMAGAGQMQMPLQQQQQQVPGFSGFQQQQQQPGFPGMAGMAGVAQNPMQQPGLPDFQQQQQTGFSGFQQQPGFSGFQPQQQQQQGFAGY